MWMAARVGNVVRKVEDTGRGYREMGIQGWEGDKGKGRGV